MMMRCFALLASAAAMDISGFYGHGPAEAMNGWTNLLPIDTSGLDDFEKDIYQQTNGTIRALARLVPGADSTAIYVRGLNSTILLPGWKDALKEVFDAEVLPRLSSGVVRGVMLGDELCCGNSTCVTASLYPLSAEVRRLIGPSHLMWTNECGSTITGGKIPWIGPLTAPIPPDLDIFGIDVYWGYEVGMDPKREVALARSFAEKHLYPKMHAAQRVMMVPGTFACSNFSYMPLEQSEASVVTKLEGYEAWGNEDPYSRPDANPEAPSLRPSAPRSRLTPPPSGRRVAGMNPWHWRTRNKTQHKPPCDMRVGAGAMPKVVAKLKEIGSKIIAPH